MNYLAQIHRQMSTRLLRLPAAVTLILLFIGCTPYSDRPAIFEDSALTQSQIEQLNGSYHSTGDNGDYVSLSWTARERSWQLRSIKDSSSAVNALFTTSLPAANWVKKGESDVLPLHFEGVALASYIPGTELILVAVPSATVRIREPNKPGLTESPDPTKPTNKNIFAIFKKEGRTLTLKIFSDSDDSLKAIFGDLKKPLPTDRLLVYLKANAAKIMADESLPVYLRSSPSLAAHVDARIEASLDAADDRERKKDEELAKLAPKPATPKPKPPISSGEPVTHPAPRVTNNTSTPPPTQPASSQRRPLTAKETGEVIGWMLKMMVGSDSSNSSSNSNTSASRNPSVAPNGALASCRADASRHITECAKVTDYSTCGTTGCDETIICDARLSDCVDHDSPYGARGIFYCDTRNWRNRDANREVVLNDACATEREAAQACNRRVDSEIAKCTVGTADCVLGQGCTYSSTVCDKYANYCERTIDDEHASATGEVFYCHTKSPYTIDTNRQTVITKACN